MSNKRHQKGSQERYYPDSSSDESTDESSDDSAINVAEAKAYALNKLKKRPKTKKIIVKKHRKAMNLMGNVIWDVNRDTGLVRALEKLQRTLKKAVLGRTAARKIYSNLKNFRAALKEGRVDGLEEATRLSRRIEKYSDNEWLILSLVQVRESISFGPVRRSKRTSSGACRHADLINVVQAYP